MLNINDIKYNGPCIYCIWDDQSQKLYFGQTKTYRKRALEHQKSLENNRHCNIYLQRLFDKEYNLNIGLIEICNVEELDDKEIFWIAFFKTNLSVNGFNFTKGGKRGKDLSTLNIEARKKQGLSQRGRTSPTKGKSLSQEHKDRISEMTKGKPKPYSEQHLENIRQFHKNRKGKRRVYKKIKAIDLDSNKELIFDSIVQTAEFFGKKGHTLSTHFGKQQSIVYNNYKLEKIQDGL